MNAGAVRRRWAWLPGHSAAVLLVLTASGLAAASRPLRRCWMSRR